MNLQELRKLAEADNYLTTNVSKKDLLAMCDLIAQCKEALEGTHSYYTIASGKFKPARNAEVLEAIAAIEQWEKK